MSGGFVTSADDSDVGGSVDVSKIAHVERSKGSLRWILIERVEIGIVSLPCHAEQC